MRHAVDAGAFFGGGFGFVAESGEEPGRAALVVVFGSGGCHAPAVAGCCSAGLADTGHAGAALLVELGGLGVVEDDVGRPAASVVRFPRLPGVVGQIAIYLVPAAVARPDLLAGDPRGVDVECPGAVRQDVGSDGPGEGLAGDDD